MKKLLVLMLVLGMSSLASAGISLSGIPAAPIAEGDVVSIGIVNDDAAGYVAYLSVYYISEGGFSMSNLRLGPDAGDFTSWIDYTYSDIWEAEVTLASTPGSNPVAGTWFLADFTCTLKGVNVMVELWDAADLSAPIETAMIEQIPEPMTLALLGLGGLFMLRRRK